MKSLLGVFPFSLRTGRTKHLVLYPYVSVFCSPRGLMRFVFEVSCERRAERSSPCLWDTGCPRSSQGLTYHVLPLRTRLLEPNVGGTTNGRVFPLGESESLCSLGRVGG